MLSDTYKFEIQGIEVGRNHRPYVLAEIGINHEGDVDLAERLIHAAKESGADGVKFQTFKAGDLAHPDKAPEYYKLFKSVELSYDAHVHLHEVAKNIGIAFISTPFGIPEVDQLMEIGVAAIKIASGDLTNYPLLEHAAGTALPVILSTGMSYLKEVTSAREVLVNGGCDKLAILHCVSRYPTIPEELNLRVVETLLDKYPEVIGFSDHTEGIWAAPGAVALGATFIEKHFTLDRTMPGPDHALSVEPDELNTLIHAVRNTFDSLGDGEKKPCPLELKNREKGRKGLYAARDLDLGNVITFADLKISRPEGEIPASEFTGVVGQTLSKAMKEGDELTRDAFAG